jgi:hypothetical protein
VCGWRVLLLPKGCYSSMKGNQPLEKVDPNLVCGDYGGFAHVEQKCIKG